MNHDPHSLTPPGRVILMSVIALLALCGCHKETDVAQVNPTIADEACLPFEDYAAIEAAIGGTWRVRTLQKTVTLMSCENAAFNGRIVISDGIWVTYDDPALLVLERFPPLYQLSGVEDDGRDRFTARIDSYDCGTSAGIYSRAHALWFLCTGRFVPESGRVAGSCAGAEMDTNVDDFDRQGTCELSEPLFFDMEHIPV